MDNVCNYFKPHTAMDITEAGHSEYLRALSAKQDECCCEPKTYKDSSTSIQISALWNMLASQTKTIIDLKERIERLENGDV